ncbi:expressed unknown protein [Seminavis robusta]|uniref:Uncharacterized protein n=1 Tax=Seminavis robusta TaxID=568900 RepID=A0A9N8EQB8_9STRA|nr:expressed unknown protein [Seminavis robusta]|eukprot:Sro1658_g289120.1 n/a (312) ;mRNA; r:2450-3385
MAETLHNSKRKPNWLPKAPERSSIDDDCTGSITTVQISNVRQVTVRWMSGENRGGTDQDQLQDADAQQREVVRGRLNGIITALTETQRRSVLRTLQSNASNPGSLLPKPRFSEIFGRCLRAQANVDRLYDDCAADPEIFISVVSIQAQELLTALHRRQRARQLEVQRAKQRRMQEIAEGIGGIVQVIASNGDQVAHIVEALTYLAVDSTPLTFDDFEHFVQDAGAQSLASMRDSVEQFVEIFNRNLVESGEELTRLSAAIENRRLPGGPEAVGPAGDEVSDLSGKKATIQWTRDATILLLYCISCKIIADP